MKPMIFFGTLLLILLFPACRTSQPSAEDMRKEISKHLPIGSTKSQVSNFLGSRKISHSDIQDHNEYDEQHRWVNVTIMTASIRHEGFWSQSHVYMVFYFDDSGQLTKYDVKNVRKGL
jgi:outer membrane protein assembly factor BamE (lipoprotein component of BamABCDE complex)